MVICSGNPSKEHSYLQKLKIRNFANMLVIRYFRTGKKNQPSFKIVVTDKRKSSRGGRFVEEVGFWNPINKEKVLKADRIKYWISVGAKLSGAVHNLLIEEKIIEGKKIPVHDVKKEKTPLPSTGEAVKPRETRPAETSTSVQPAPQKQEKPAEKIPERKEPPKEEKQTLTKP